jgi:hypothetical protein
MKDKTLKGKYKGITEKLVTAAFPTLIVGAPDSNEEEEE